MLKGPLVCLVERPEISTNGLSPLFSSTPYTSKVSAFTKSGHVTYHHVIVPTS